MNGPFDLNTLASRRILALALLNAAPEVARLTRKAGSFLGQCAVDPTPLSDKQLEWLAQLAERAGLEVEANDGQ